MILIKVNVLKILRPNTFEINLLSMIRMGLNSSKAINKVEELKILVDLTKI